MVTTFIVCTVKVVQLKCSCLKSSVVHFRTSRVLGDAVRNINHLRAENLTSFVVVQGV